jgi:hypothetical protein
VFFLVALFLAIPAHGTVTLTSTTLAAAVTSTSTTTIYVANATDFTAGNLAYADGELMEVRSTGSTTVTVRRGVSPTRAVTHASGATIYVGLPVFFQTSSASERYAGASCVAGNEPVSPIINAATRNIADCQSSKIVIINGPAAAGVGLTGLGPVTAGNIPMGAALLPFQKLYLGTAATNNMVITPAATAAARIITMTDPGGAASLAYTNPTTAQTITNTTLTAPTINAAIVSDTAKCTTQFDAVTGTTGATLTNLTGMVLTVVPGTYRFYINLPMVTTANAGVKTGFKLTSTVLTSIDYTSRLFTAAGVAVQHGTTTADQTAMAALTAAATINTVIEGTMVVGTGGTIQMQAAQNAAHADTLSIYVGASMTFTRIL